MVDVLLKLLERSYSDSKLSALKVSEISANIHYSSKFYRDKIHILLRPIKKKLIFTVKVRYRNKKPKDDSVAFLMEISACE